MNYYSNYYTENQLNEEILYESIIEYLINEGFTNTIGGAEIIFENMSDNFRIQIIETVLGGESRFRPGQIGRALVGAGVQAAQSPEVRRRVSNFVGNIYNRIKNNKSGSIASNDQNKPQFRDEPLWRVPGGPHPKDPPKRKPINDDDDGYSGAPPRREPLF